MFIQSHWLCVNSNCDVSLSLCSKWPKFNETNLHQHETCIVAQFLTSSIRLYSGRQLKFEFFAGILLMQLFVDQIFRLFISNDSTLGYNTPIFRIFEGNNGIRFMNSFWDWTKKPLFLSFFIEFRNRHHNEFSK